MSTASVMGVASQSGVLSRPVSGLPGGSGARLTHLLGLGRLAPVSLEEVVARADLSVRVDRKYLVGVPVAVKLIGALADSHQVLHIANRRYTSYRSTYFDTPDLTSCRAHIQGRRRRWKVRSRLYVEDAVCRIEVKAKTGRGDTDKIATLIDPGRYGQFDEEAHDFVARALECAHPDLDVSRLAPTAELACVRTTMVDLAAGTRATFDWRVNGALRSGRVWIDEAYLVVETKGGATPAAADRALLALGARPRGFSKYVAVASSLYPELPDNDVRALRGHLLHVTRTPE